MALLYSPPGSDRAFAFCSGTLIAPTVVLTASHCTVGTAADMARGYTFRVTNVDDLPTDATGWVPLASLPADSVAIVAEDRTHPDHHQPYTEDVAAYVLASPLDAGVALPSLAPVGMLDAMKDAKTLRTTPMLVMGYGSEEMVTGPGGTTFPDSGERRWAELDVSALDRQFVHQSQRIHQGEQGACYGDSGGPSFVEQDGVLYVVAVTSTGDGPCWATNVASRVDRAPARAWIDQVLASAA